MTLRNNGMTPLRVTVRTMAQFRAQLVHNLVLRCQHRESHCVCSVVYAVPLENANFGHITCYALWWPVEMTGYVLVRTAFLDSSAHLHYTCYHSSNTMVSTIEGVIYGGSVLLSTLAGGLGLHVLSRVPGLDGLNDLSTASYALYSTLTGLGLLVAVILYRWPYMESALTFGQIKGQSFHMQLIKMTLIYRSRARRLPLGIPKSHHQCRSSRASHEMDQAIRSYLSIPNPRRWLAILHRRSRRSFLYFKSPRHFPQTGTYSSANGAIPWERSLDCRRSRP